MTFRRKQIQAIIDDQVDPLLLIPATFFVPHAREVELVLRCCRFPQNEQDRQRILELAGEAPDWAFIQKYAYQEGLAPLLHHSLKCLPGGVLPEGVKVFLSQAAWSYAERNLRLSAELVKVLQLFKEHGIDAIPFKGPVMANAIYGDLRSRTSGDLDILVHRQDVLAARELLPSCGFSAKESPALGELHEELLESKDFSFSSRDGVHIELHWEILPPSMPFLPVAETLWPETVRVPFLDQSVLQFNPEVQFVLLCVHHGVSHFYEWLSQVCDIDRFIKAYPDMHWDRVLSLAGQSDCIRAVLLGCLMAKLLLGTSLPPEITALLQQNTTVQCLVIDIIAWRTKNDSKPLRLSSRLWIYLHVKSSWRGKLHLVSRLLLTPKRVDRQFIQLPASLRVLYLIVRPLRLLCGFLLGKNLER